MYQAIRVENLRTPELTVYHTLSDVQLNRINEPGPGLFIAESAKVIVRALNAGYLPVSFLMETHVYEEKGRDLLSGCPGDFPVYTADEEILFSITGYHLTGGMLCAMQRKPLCSPEEICRYVSRIAVLENVTNPTNAGSIIRNAAAFGFGAVLFSQGCTDPLYRRAARVSMGTVFQIPWTFLPEGDTVSLVRKMGFQTVALALRNDTLRLDDPLLKKAERLAVLFGSEGDGLLPETIRSCDHCVRIPMSNQVDSLNVAACSAVVFYALKDDGITDLPEKKGFMI